MTKKTSWLDMLKEKGYRYMISIDGNSVWTTKANMLKSGEFKVNSNFDEYTFEDGEDWPKNRLLKKFYFIGVD